MHCPVRLTIELFFVNSMDQNTDKFYDKIWFFVLPKIVSFEEIITKKNPFTHTANIEQDIYYSG